MGRTKTYIREDVLDAVTELFWSKGYEATSMSDIVKFGGLNRHSLYKEFGDKEGLFMACLNYYASDLSRDLKQLLTKKPLGLSNIREFFIERATYADSKQCRGCFLVNSVSDQDIVSSKVRDKIQSMLSEHDEFFYSCLSAAQERGEIPKSKDCRALASYTSCVLRGLMSIGRTKTSLVPPEQIVGIALESLTR